MKGPFFKILCLSLSIFAFAQCNAQIQFSLNSQYRFLKGSAAASLDDSWVTPEFNHEAWALSPAPFHFGDGSGGTYLVDMKNNYSTVYLRSTFMAKNIEKLEEISLSVNYDDGFVIWINGEEVLRRNAPQNLSHVSFASGSHESGSMELYHIPVSGITLNEGENVICIQGLNISLESTDFYFDMEMRGELALDKQLYSLEKAFSHPAGFYDAAFELTIKSPDPLAKIAYTIDGTDPLLSESQIIAEDSVTIWVDPQSHSGRPQTPVFIVRASIMKEGYRPTNSISKSYIFPEYVKTQSYPGGDWPETNINGQFIDMDVSDEIAQDPKYKDDIVDALLDIPSLSIVSDLSNFFDAAKGIYVNAGRDGVEWERPCSVELLNCKDDEGFQSNAGIRIRGGYSRSGGNPKHSFRIFFRSEYGNAKLEYPLFGNEGVSEFDKIDLRTAQNYSWSNEYSLQNTFVREVFARDSQKDMGRPYTRSRYYHLYLNGMYWGLYQTQERSEARYAEDYLGGEREDYDVVKVNAPGGYVIETTDGNMDAWRKVYELCLKGFSSNENYFRLQGRNYNGDMSDDLEVLVDIDNLIDYMLVIFYTGSTDAPISKGLGNDSPNNFYALYNRNDRRSGFKFFAHDSEHSMLYLYEDRINLGDDISVANFSKFNPQWLHERLSENAEYRQRFADRALLHLEGKGVLSPMAAKERFQNRASMIENAILAESLRWGDVKGSPARTKENWQNEINNVLNNYLEKRSAIVVNQLRFAHLYSTLNAPVVKSYGAALTQENYPLNTKVTISLENPNSGGEIYFSMNGEDPRTIGGAVSQQAKKAMNGEALEIRTSADIKVRIYDKGSWSALRNVRFNKYSDLKVTELHYHPMDFVEEGDTISGKSFEFIEFKNTGDESLNVAGMLLDSAVYYRFPARTLIQPEAFYVVATKPKSFFQYYGVEASGNCSGFFSNSGERVVLNDPFNHPILSFVYADTYPWPFQADGLGYSLSSVYASPTGDPAYAEYWQQSSKTGGSPFADDARIQSEVEDMADEAVAGIRVYPNPTNGLLHISTEEEHAEIMKMTIVSMSGGIVLSSEINVHGTVDLSAYGLPKGVYMLSVVSGNRHFHEKIIYY